MKSERKQAQSQHIVPIAIIGIGCRFPGGANTPQAFWQLLTTGTDAIVDVPGDRWSLKQFYDPNPGKPGKMYVCKGGFLQEKLDEFDSQFFGISPREAASLDPQQRLILELAWEALEDAGVPLQTVSGANVGVYVGCFTLDNKMIQLSPLNRHLIESHTATSSTMAIPEQPRLLRI